MLAKQNIKIKIRFKQGKKPVRALTGGVGNQNEKIFVDNRKKCNGR